MEVDGGLVEPQGCFACSPRGGDRGKRDKYVFAWIQKRQKYGFTVDSGFFLMFHGSLLRETDGRHSHRDHPLSPRSWVPLCSPRVSWMVSWRLSGQTAGFGCAKFKWLWKRKASHIIPFWSS